MRLDDLEGDVELEEDDDFEVWQFWNVLLVFGFVPLVCSFGFRLFVV